MWMALVMVGCLLQLHFLASSWSELGLTCPFYVGAIAKKVAFSLGAQREFVICDFCEVTEFTRTHFSKGLPLVHFTANGIK